MSKREVCSTLAGIVRVNPINRFKICQKIRWGQVIPYFKGVKQCKVEHAFREREPVQRVKLMLANVAPWWIVKDKSSTLTPNYIQPFR